MGLGGAVGVFFGSYIAERLALKDIRWYVWLPSLAGFMCTPFLVATYLVNDPYHSFFLQIVPGILFNVYLGNALAMTHGLVGLRMRALSSAVLFFILNIIGLGLGPWLVGILSDTLAPSFGIESLRYAMVFLIPPVMCWSALHFYFGGRTLANDLANAPD